MTDSVRAEWIGRERWRTLEPHVDRALELPAVERAEYVAQLRERDAMLGAELERFLDECDRPDKRFESSAPVRYGYLLNDSVPAPLAAGSVLKERFEIVRELGRGGMAIVYLARDRKLDHRLVAVKVIRRGSLSTQSAQRFLAEIRLTVKLNHPNIVAVYDAELLEDEQLFFVMPYIEGETLRDRLAREDPPLLPISDALRIGIDVARALEYAHEKGVTHRDVKPSNLLLASGVAMLADFGIARGDASGDTLTDVGVRLGTPAYMSPEQVDFGDKVDSRTDIYSLGCVLYEMIAGERPRAASKRLVDCAVGPDPVRPLREMREGISPKLNACVMAALAVEKTQRIQTSGELARMLETCAREYGVRVSRWKRLYWGAPRTVAVAASLATIAMISGGLILVRRGPVSGDTTPVAATPVTLAGSPMDTSRIVVLPFEAPAVAAGADDADRVRDGVKAWDGVTAVDRLETRNALVGRDSTPLTAAVAGSISRGLRAGRYISGEVTRDGDSTVFRAGLYDARTGAALANASVRWPARRPRTDATFARLADQLLFPGVPESTVVAVRRATHSRPALQSYVRSQAAIAAWDLDGADAALTAATNYDSQFALAYLWLAQVRAWREMPLGAWQFAAHRAVTARTRLTARERLIADALTATASLDSARACDIWRSLTRRPDAEQDFAAWYGVARCETSDRAVLRDRNSPSGWRFRSSYQHATEAFRRAFQILPAIHHEFRSNWYTSLKRTLRTQRTQLRYGIALPPDTGHFAAYASWSTTGDTLEFIPYPLQAFEEGRTDVVPATARQATEHQRDVFLDIATTWRSAFAPSPDALLAVAIALDEAGLSQAVDSVHAARRLADQANDAAARLMTGAAEVWMLVKRSVPNDVQRLEAARFLADSLIRGVNGRAPDSTQAIALASLAALTGRVHLAARFARDAEELVLGPTAVKPSVRALQAYAALGVPVDSLRALTDMVWRATAPNVRPIDRARWMRRAAPLAFLSWPDSTIRVLARGGDYLAVAESAWMARDSATVRQRLLPLREGRRMAAPEDLKLESLFPEAWLLNAIGDSALALDWLTPTLDAQARASVENLRSPVAAAALVRSMALRAQLAKRLGRDAEARTYARAVLALWEDADGELRPVVKEMKRLAR